MLQQFPITPVLKDFDRCWVTDEYFDLYVWFHPDRSIYGFQLCYDKPGTERAFTWIPSRGSRHALVDSGEECPDTNSAPILLAGGSFNAGAVLEQFILRSSSVDACIRDVVIQALQEAAGSQPS
jgi:hypothetical protein